MPLRWQPVEYDWADIRFNLWHTHTRSHNTFYYLEGDFVNFDYVEEESKLAERYRRWGGDISNTMRFNAYGVSELSYGFAVQQEDIGPQGSDNTWGTSRDGEREEYSAFVAVKWQPLPALTVDSGIRYTRFSTEDHKAIELKEDSSYCEDFDNDGQCDPVFYQSSNSGTAPIVSLTWTSLNLWEESETSTAAFLRMRNIDKADFHGIELNLDYDLGWFFTQLGGTRYTHIEVCHHGSYRRYDCTDYGIANSYINNMIPPQWHASALLGGRFFSGQLEFGVRGTFMGQRTLGQFHDDTSNGFNQPVPWHSYNLLDLFISWQYSDWLTADFNIDNLTDQYYLDALSLGLVPAPGRTAKLSLTLHF